MFSPPPRGLTFMMLPSLTPCVVHEAFPCCSLHPGRPGRWRDQIFWSGQIAGGQRYPRCNRAPVPVYSLGRLTRLPQVLLGKCPFCAPGQRSRMDVLPAYGLFSITVDTSRSADEYGYAASSIWRSRAKHCRSRDFENLQSTFSQSQLGWIAKCAGQRVGPHASVLKGAVYCIPSDRERRSSVSRRSFH